MTVRMKDIAKDLGAWIVTVSKALRNNPDIPEETRERVFKRVRELDYHPNMLARSLVTGRSFLVGLIVPDLLHPFFAEIAKSLSVCARGRVDTPDHRLVDEDPEVEARNPAPGGTATGCFGDRFLRKRHRGL